jgi:hypothetical protein
MLNLDLALKLLSEYQNGVVAQRLSDSYHLTKPQQRLDKFTRTYFERFAYILDRSSALDLGRRFGSGSRLLLHSRTLGLGGSPRITETASAPFASRLRINDDPAFGRLVLTPSYP